jgi:hypothetical protein
MAVLYAQNQAIGIIARTFLKGKILYNVLGYKLQKQ